MNKYRSSARTAFKNDNRSASDPFRTLRRRSSVHSQQQPAAASSSSVEQSFRKSPAHHRGPQMSSPQASASSSSPADDIGAQVLNERPSEVSDPKEGVAQCEPTVGVSSSEASSSSSIIPFDDIRAQKMSEKISQVSDYRERIAQIEPKIQFLPEAAREAIPAEIRAQVLKEKLSRVSDFSERVAKCEASLEEDRREAVNMKRVLEQRELELQSLKEALAEFGNKLVKACPALAIKFQEAKQKAAKKSEDSITISSEA